MWVVLKDLISICLQSHNQCAAGNKIVCFKDSSSKKILNTKYRFESYKFKDSLFSFTISLKRMKNFCKQTLKLHLFTKGKMKIV